jgi:Fic family protein
MPFSAHEYNWQAPAWPSFSYDTQAVASALLEANRAHGYAEGKLSAVGLSAQKGIYADAWAPEALATAAIEGERLNLEAVQSSIARRLGTPQRKSTTTPRHVDGLLDIMEDALSRASAPLTHERLCAWQAALFPTGFSGLNKITVGAYRDHEEAMQIVSKRLDERVQVHYEAPPAVRVRSEMQALLDWLNQAGYRRSRTRRARASLVRNHSSVRRRQWPRGSRRGRPGAGARCRRLGSDVAHLAPVGGPAGRLLRATRACITR